MALFNKDAKKTEKHYDEWKKDGRNWRKKYERLVLFFIYLYLFYFNSIHQCNIAIIHRFVNTDGMQFPSSVADIIKFEVGNSKLNIRFHVFSHTGLFINFLCILVTF